VSRGCWRQRGGAARGGCRWTAHCSSHCAGKRSGRRARIFNISISPFEDAARYDRMSDRPTKRKELIALATCDLLVRGQRRTGMRSICGGTRKPFANQHTYFVINSADGSAWRMRPAPSEGWDRNSLVTASANMEAEAALLGVARPKLACVRPLSVSRGLGSDGGALTFWPFQSPPTFPSLG